MLVYIGTGILLFSLLLPRFYLHLASIVGCSFMWAYAYQLGDHPLLVSQSLFLGMNCIGLARTVYLSKKKQHSSDHLSAQEYD